MLSVSLDHHLPHFHLKLEFQVPTGTTMVLLGESGAGKTTTLQLLAGLTYPQRGSIALDGQIYFDHATGIKCPPQERATGYVFQDYILFPHLSVFENIAFGLRAQRLASTTITQRVDEVLERLALTEFAQRRPHQLSGGQQQRVAIARALVLRPRLLLLDEPLAALDVQTRRDVRQELRQILQDLTITTVMVTHQYVEALLFGQQILVLDQGQVIQQGNQQELRESPRSSYIAELVGVNFFRGHISSYETATTCIVQLADSQSQIIATLREQISNEPGKPIGTDAYVIVDPRSITLHTARPEGSARNIFQGEILHLLQLGSGPQSSKGQVRVSIRLDNFASNQPLQTEITSDSVTRMKLHEGQKLYATWKASEAWVYV